MYLEYYSLDRPPFRITPDPSLFFTGGANGRGVVLEALLYAVTSGEGILKVVGEVGSGKTMLCRMLEERLPESVEIVYLANPNLSAHDILYAIAFELKLSSDHSTQRLVLMQQLQEYLLKQHALNRTVLVIIEEAQSMPIATLEEIRLFSNLETHQHKLMQIVLFGQPELDKNLAQKSIRQLRERITHSFYLGPLGVEETSDYIRFRLQAAGCPCPQVFSTAAERLIAKASGGLTRRINILADKALLAAYSESATAVRPRSIDNQLQPTVLPRHVRAAINDSGYRNSFLSWPRATIAAALLVIVALGGWWWQSDAPQDLADIQLLEPASSVALSTAPVQVAAPVAEEQIVEPPAEMAVQVAPPETAVASTIDVPEVATLAAIPLAVAEAEESADNLIEATELETADLMVTDEVVAQPAPVADLAPAVLATRAIPEQQPADAVIAVVANTLVVAETSVAEPAIEQPSAEQQIAEQQVEEQPSGDQPQELISSPDLVEASVVPVVDTEEVAPIPVSAGVQREDLPVLMQVRSEAMVTWQRRADPDSYVVQLLSVGVAESDYVARVLSRLEQSGHIDQTYVCLASTETEGRQFWKVFYADFPSVVPARAFIDRLPANVRANGPFAQNLSRLNCDSSLAVNQ